MDVVSQTNVSELGGNLWLIAVLVIFIILTAIGVSGVLAAVEEADGEMALMSLTVIVVFGILTYFANGWASVEHTEYKVIVDDFNEVHENYEIIDQDGDIYTVIKKEDE